MRASDARRRASGARALCIVLLIALLVPPAGWGYSVLTHEQLIDLAWNDSIRPLLLSRYPNASEAQLQEAHAYAYGGSAIQDMGYYPFGKEFFSDLTHYVRSGDFVASLFRNARNVNELAFAVGALSHYIGDNIGHSECVNPATGVEFPNLEKKYGDSVTYDESPHSHIRTEFAFDIDQLERHRLAPAAYLEHIGLRVPRELVERAFYETYGLSLREVLGPEFPAIRSYRSAVRSFIPRFAHAEVVLHGSQFPTEIQNDDFIRYEREVARADFQKRWAKDRHHPGIRTHLLAWLIFILPKIGPISDLAIRIPNQQTQDWYEKSVNDTMAQFRAKLAALHGASVLAAAIPNTDLDTGNPVKPGGYALTDKTYAELLRKLTSFPGRPLPPDLQRNIVSYYADPNAPIVTKKDHHAWTRVQSELALLKTMPVRNSVHAAATNQTAGRLP